MREKLIELIISSGKMSGFAGGLADHLITNGVRLEEKQATSDQTSEWISVKDRLPEDYETVLVYDGDFVQPSSFHGKYGFWTTDCYEADSIYGATHWMPLPEPPKGE